MRGDAIDMAVLEGLRLLHREGKPDIAKTVIMLFLDNTPAVLAELEQGARRDDVKMLERASHILGSSAAAVGAVLLSSHCKDLEVFARRGSVPNAAARVRVIMTLYEDAEQALRTWCSGQR